jgi:hypothetical protein
VPVLTLAVSEEGHKVVDELDEVFEQDDSERDEQSELELDLLQAFKPKCLALLQQVIVD